MYPNVHCTIYYESESHSVVSNSLWPHGLYSPSNSPGQNTGVGSLSLLQGIFPTQGLNPDLLHCRWILYQLSHKGIPRILEWVAYPFSSGSYWPIELGSPALQANSLPTELPGKPTEYYGSNPNMPWQMISFRRCLCLSLSHTHTHTHSGILFSHKRSNTAICSNVDGSKEYYAKWNKLEKDKYCMISLPCGL